MDAHAEGNIQVTTALYFINKLEIFNCESAIIFKIYNKKPLIAQ